MPSLQLWAQVGLSFSAMPELYLALDDDLMRRVFACDDTHYSYVPGFVKPGQTYVPFKTTIDKAIEAATTASSPKARGVTMGDTTWMVLQFHMTFEQIGRLTMQGLLQVTPSKDGVNIFTTVRMYSFVYNIAWPQKTPREWLASRGFTAHLGTECKCCATRRVSPHENKYKIDDNNVLCETCLMAQELGISVDLLA